MFAAPRGHYSGTRAPGPWEGVISDPAGSGAIAAGCPGVDFFGGVNDQEDRYCTQRRDSSDRGHCLADRSVQGRGYLDSDRRRVQSLCTQGLQSVQPVQSLRGEGLQSVQSVRGKESVQPVQSLRG